VAGSNSNGGTAKRQTTVRTVTVLRFDMIFPQSLRQATNPIFRRSSFEVIEPHYTPPGNGCVYRRRDRGRLVRQNLNSSQFLSYLKHYADMQSKWEKASKIHPGPQRHLTLRGHSRPDGDGRQHRTAARSESSADRSTGIFIRLPKAPTAKPVTMRLQ
jgi:hypothetical protein